MIDPVMSAQAAASPARTARVLNYSPRTPNLATLIDDMSSRDQMNRHPKGQPVGGRFAAASKDEPRQSLAAPGPDAEHEDVAERAENEVRRREAIAGATEDPSIRTAVVDGATRKLTAQDELYDAWKRGAADPADDELFERIWDGEAPGMSAAEAEKQSEKVVGLAERFESGQMTETDDILISVYGSDEDAIRENLQRAVRMWEEAITSHGRSLAANQSRVLRLRQAGSAGA